MSDKKKWTEKDVQDRKREAQERVEHIDREADKMIDKFKDQLVNDLSVPNGLTNDERK